MRAEFRERSILAPKQVRAEDGRYYYDSDSIRGRPILTPVQVAQVQTGLSETPSGQINYPELTADQNDFKLGAAFVHRFTSDASRTITGFAGMGVGIQVAVNGGAQDVVLANNNAGSEDPNKILTHTGANITLGPNESVAVFYDFKSERVRTVGFT